MLNYLATPPAAVPVPTPAEIGIAFAELNRAQKAIDDALAGSPEEKAAIERLNHAIAWINAHQLFMHCHAGRYIHGRRPPRH